MIMHVFILVLHNALAHVFISFVDILASHKMDPQPWFMNWTGIIQRTIFYPNLLKIQSSRLNEIANLPIFNYSIKRNFLLSGIACLAHNICYNESG